LKLEHVSRLDRELGDVFGAIELVSCGRADRVEVCNLRHARRILALVRPSLDDPRIELRAISREGTSAIDILVERVGAEVTS
jgi:hypothetical protein